MNVARLAGGFTSLTAEHLEPATRQALGAGRFTQLERVRHLPGMTHAAAGTLRNVWDADVDLHAMGEARGGRIRELALIENRVRDRLPRAMRTLRDLRD